jgi:hypothetical protein
MPPPAKPAVENQILLEYNPAEYTRIANTIGFVRLDLGRQATAQETEDYVAEVVMNIVFGAESHEASISAVAATTKITRK